MLKQKLQNLYHVILFTILDTELKPIIWSNILKMPYGNDQSLDIKLYNDKVLLAKGVLIVPSTL